MSGEEGRSSSRRAVLRYGGVALAGGIAGCSSGSGDESPETEQNGGGDSGTTTPTSSTTTGTPGATSGCGPGETTLASSPDPNTEVTVTGAVTGIDTGLQLLYVDDGTASGAILTGDAANVQDFAEGDCVTVTGTATDATVPQEVGTVVTALEIRSPGKQSESVLEQPLPDPSQYINARQSNFERAVGTVTIQSDDGLTLQGPGQNQVTAIAGYVDGADLAANQNWGGSVDNGSKLVSTSAGAGSDSLRLDLFRGVALRAVSGIDLVVDGTTVAEGVRLVRYSQDDGVFERESVSE